MIDEIRASLASQRNPRLVDELLAAYQEAKSNFYQGGKRLSAVEGGRFCEAAFRLLEEAIHGGFTPLSKKIDAEKISRDLAQTPVGSFPDSIRLHIPRTLRVVYDIRNNRNAAHLADGIDPNLQDAVLVASALDWVLAEFLRLWHNVSADEAQDIVEQLVTRKAPVIQDFDGYLKVLNPDLTAGDHIMVLLYQCGAAGATFFQLYDWARPNMRQNLARTIRRLDDQLAYVHSTDKKIEISLLGREYVETNKLIVP